MEEKKYDITETKEVLDFVFALVKTIEKSLEDGKIDYSDVMNLLPAFSKLGLAFKDIEMVPKELGDLDKEEADALKEYFAKNFDIANDKIEFYIEKALEIILALYFLIKDITNANK